MNKTAKHLVAIIMSIDYWFIHFSIDKSIERFEKFMDKVSMPIALICATFLIGRMLVSFIFGI